MKILLLTLVHVVLLITGRPPSDLNARAGAHLATNVLIFDIITRACLCTSTRVYILGLLLAIPVGKVQRDGSLVEGEDTLEVFNRVLGTKQHVIDALLHLLHSNRVIELQERGRGGRNYLQEHLLVEIRQVETS